MESTKDLRLPTWLATEIIRLAEESGPQFKERRFTDEQLDKMSSAEVRSWQARRLCMLDAQDSGFGARVAEFAEGCFARLGLRCSPERVLGNFIGVQRAGAWVQPHRDPFGEQGQWHLRLNFLVQKPIAGGVVMLGDFLVEPDEGEAWLNFASNRFHACSPVEGDRARVILSLGTYVDPTTGAAMLQQYELELGGLV
jgi:hypothetical protein